MKKVFWAALILPFLAWASVSLGMQQSQVPPKFSIPWGGLTPSSTYFRSIPVPSQIGITNCAASLSDGFPPLTFQPASAGGCPPFGVDFNGVFRQITQWSQWQGAGAAPLYDVSFSTSIGGYPSGAVLANATTPGCFWVSTADNNGSNPDAGGANWSGSCPGGGAAGTSTGSANAQVVAATPFTLTVGRTVTFAAGFSNSGPLQINVNGAGLVNVFRRSQLGATMSVGGEVVAGQMVTVQWDGTRWQCTSCQFVRVGEVLDMATTTLPAGHLVGDGSCVSQSTYADLFSLLGTSFGSCSAGLFALPDLRGRMTAGYDTQGTQGAANRMTSAGSGCVATGVAVGCGSQNQTIAQSNLPNATLSYTPSGTVTNTDTSTTWLTVGGTTDSGLKAGTGTIIGGGQAGFTGTGASTSSINGNVSQTTMTILPPLQTVLKIVKY